MSQKVILFDLDGTLTDSGEGIINSAIPVLEHFGLPVPPKSQLRIFVGPPLRDSFLKAGVAEENVEEAIRIYRSRYTTVGKFENFPYPGIPEMLIKLRQAGHRLFVATSKPEVTALEVLEKFELTGYFEQIVGATFDGTRSHKADVIAYLLNKLSDVPSIVMVGDTAFDVLGAAAHNIPTIGVSWGYGKVADMEQAGAMAIAHSMDELIALLNQ